MKQAERIFILPQNAEGQQDLKIITLPHPRTGAAARFMVRSGQVLEIQKVTERYRCWFKDNYVHKDGSLFIATEVDPLFLLVPLLEKNRKQTSESAGYFCEKDQILTEDFEAYPGYAHFLEWPTLPLGLVCDTKGSLRGGARAANYRDSTPLTDAELTKAAIGFISDYINNDWQTKLCEAYGFGGNAEVYEWEQDEISKYAYDGGAAKTAEPKTPQKSLAQKKLEKVDKRGMKTLTSFFAVKKKE
ncbi:Ydr279p family (RNase H2 complex component) protein [Acanthamoeba castellanii str. Neff]|uniref:Ydr279p family (RNase H2 complex component) protein n=1 Tax=Acanthamoeba castellanii (strain ATCC 30010 / Neff) TaxID=1257118 RepID=L8H7C2_ACACF|nr:Ydr279p family (RNase H2 complex component) protein [Acanthamoeba castellanii str. Neff]ELR21040.1 Ydr279p family (RNase H2 complex component) protein [Acanthamoeba castellanii str. Neff]